MQPSSPLSSVGATALAAARVRAAESARPGRLFDDPFANLLLQDRDLAGPVAQSVAPDLVDQTGAARRRFLAFHVVIRTRFYDDQLLDATGTGLRQVVLFGAGLDMRAYRLRWPHPVTVFEVDRGDILDRKAAALNRAGISCGVRRETVHADLTRPVGPALLSAGFDASQPTIWLAEGVLAYLNADATDTLITGIDALSAPGSRVAAERGSYAASSDHRGGVETLWQTDHSARPDQRFAIAGWTVNIYRLADLANEYGRPTTTPSTSEFLTACQPHRPS